MIAAAVLPLIMGMSDLVAFLLVDEKGAPISPHSQLTPVELNARAAFVAALVCLVVVGIWTIVAYLGKKKGARMTMPYLYWVFAGSSVGLFALATVGIVRSF